MDQIQRLGLTYNPTRPSYNEVLEYFKNVFSIRHGVDLAIPLGRDLSNSIVMSYNEIFIDFGGIIKLWDSKNGFEYITQINIV